MRKLLVAAALLSMATIGNASAQKCAHDDVLRVQQLNDPELAAKFEQVRIGLNQQAADYEASIANTASKTTANIMIPVVFHVILTQAQINQMGGTEGVYKRAILQLDALNRDFNGRNGDSTRIPSAFKSRYGKANLYFSLVHRKPDGKSTVGVEIRVADAGFSGFGKQTDSMKQTQLGGLDPWDNTKYLNIWVVRIATQGLLGWGYSPTYAGLLGIPEQTGIVIDNYVFGQKKSPSIGTYSSGNDSGRTLVHEMGHFFNLWHIWGNTEVGNGNCTDDDDVSDTPKQEDGNYQCKHPNSVANCNNSDPGGEMYMNFMDYTGDLCQVMFTKGQVTRMLAQLAPSGDSYELTQHPEVFAWPTDVADVEKTSGISIFPNPTKGNINIAFTNANTLKGITVINIVGQAIKQIDSEIDKSIYNFDLSNLPKGVYSVQCRFEEGTVTRKIVLQ